MCKKSFLMAAVLTGVLGLSSGNVNAQTVLKASDATNSSSGYINWRDSLPASGPDCSGGYWNKTYLSNTGFIIGDFNLTHNSGESEYSYWGGFTTGSNGNSGEYGTACTIVPCYADSTHAGSLNWVCNQWGIMAGGGLTTPPTVVKGQPYLIAYWDYYSETSGTHSLEIALSDGATFNAQDVYICNHPWPYYGNIKGDGFARPLNQPGDHFVLNIIGYVGTDSTYCVTDTLTKYNPVNPANPIQSPDWHLVDLNEMRGITSLVFTMETTDVGTWGPNTAFYFCLDKLNVDYVGKRSITKSARTSKQQPVEYNVSNTMSLNSHTGGTVAVYDALGKKLLETAIKAGGDTLDLSKLQAGKYKVRHGHKVIPINKK
jgi:hypothetical protein